MQHKIVLALVNFMALMLAFSLYCDGFWHVTAYAQWMHFRCSCTCSMLRLTDQSWVSWCMQMRGLTPRVFEHLFQRIAELDEEAVSPPARALHPCLYVSLERPA